MKPKQRIKKITIVDKEIIEEAIEEETDCKRKQKKTDREVGTDVKQKYNSPIVEVKKDTSNKNNDFKCEICDYSCNKVNIMKKHMKMKHVNHKCKMCEEEFPNSMDALAHAARDHSQNVNEGTPRKNAPSEKPEVKDAENYKTLSK